MSGGYFRYADSGLKDDMFPYSSYGRIKRDVRDNPFEDQLISELVFDVFNLIHELDWYKSGDTSEDTYLEEKVMFCQKWFGPKRSVNVVKELAERKFAETRAEIEKMIKDMEGKG